MASSLGDFLVSLGYRVDGNSEAKFKASVETATKAVTTLMATTTAASAAITATVSKIASSFDELFYASQRTKASAENIRAVGYAVSQLGGSYQAAVSSIEAFAMKMRSNPGYEAMAKNLGVVTRQNGQLRDTTKIMEDISKAAAKMPDHIAIQYLDAFGIDLKTAKALASGDSAKYQDELRKKLKAIGVDSDAAAKTGVNLSNVWRSLGATAEAFGDKLMLSLGPSIGEMVKRFDDFLIRNADRIVEFFEKARQFVEKLVDAFKLLVEKGEGPIAEFFDQVLIGVNKLEKAFDKFALFLGGAFLLSVLSSFAAVGKGFAGMLLRLGIPAAAIGLGATAMGYGPVADYLREQGKASGATDPDVQQTVGTAKAAQGAWNWVKRKLGFGGKDAGAGVDPSGGRSTGARGVAAAQEAYAFWRSKGLTHEQATGVVANEQAESGHNPAIPGDGGQAFGLYQHHPDRRANILAGAGIDMSVPNANQQREGAYWEMTKGKEQAAWRALTEAKSAGEAASVFSQLFERPKDRAGEAAKRAAIANGLAGVLSLKPAAAAVTDSTSSAKSAGPTTEEDDAAAWKRATGGRDLATDMRDNPFTATNFEHATGRKMAGASAPAAPSFDASRFNAINPARVQANAALIGGFGLSGPTALTPPPANNNTSVDMNQKTEITILGGSDPQATASAVAGAQDKVNGGLLRNMAGAVR